MLNIILLLIAWSWAAPVHTLESAIHAVRMGHADTQVLVYKVADRSQELRNQSWQPYLSPRFFQTAPLFRRPAVLSAGDEYARYFSRHYSTVLTAAEAEAVLREIFADPNLVFAYFEPRVTDAVALTRMRQARPVAAQTPPENYEQLQFHLNSAPEGIDARFAWGLAGGTGLGIRVLDVETGWHTDHLEFGPVFFDNGKNGESDHGTAVWGEIAAKPNGIGVTGIAYDVSWGLAGNGFAGDWQNYPSTLAAVIEEAIAQLNAGDILVLEQHAPLVDDYGPIEYFEPIFNLLKIATSRGIHCVAAGGNGYSNLDDAKYGGAFDLSVRDSGCVLVGAVDSPKGPRVRERSDFSNYGSRVDAAGYGEDVVTTGYGDLHWGMFENRLASYTNQFSGTSSATPIVAGAMASLLGVAKVRGIVISPAELRQALRSTGSTQVGNTSERVGNLPDLRALVSYFKLD